MNTSLLKLIPICVLFTLRNITLHAQDCCAFEAYAINNYIQELVGVDPATGNQTTVAPLSQNIGLNASGGEIIDCVYYVYSSADDVLYSIDLITGMLTSTTISCAPGLVTGLEIDPTTGIFYGISGDVNCVGTPYELVQIDLAAGTCTNTMPITDSNGAALTCATGFVIDDTGQAYVVDIVTECLVPIDLATGQATGPTLPLTDPMGNPFNINFIQGLDLDCPAGGTKLTGYLWEDTNNNQLYVCVDPATGVVTTLNNLGTFGDVFSPNFAYCNPVCEILGAEATVVCCDNGTPTIAADDLFDITLNVAGTGTSFNVTANGNTTTGFAYGADQAITGFPIINGAVTLVITDAADPNCTTTVTVNPPITCSPCAADAGEFPGND